MNNAVFNIIDSSAWLSYFAGDENAEFFADPIETIDWLLVPSICLTEVFKTVFRQRGEDPATAAIAHMKQGRVILLDDQLAVDAALLGVKHKLPLADGIIYATAQRHDAIVWTQDRDFKDLEKVRYYEKT